MIFEKVKCKAYLKAVKDGVYIQLYNSDGSLCNTRTVTDINSSAYAYKEDEVIKDLSSFDGDCVEKVYRKRVEKEFSGFLVGITNVAVKGIIGTDWYESPYCTNYGYCFKETKKEKVGVVYFRNNAKRYVPLADMED